MRSLALLHFVVNAILLWLGYYWLGIGESRTSALAWSALVALVTVCLACSAYGAAFAYFQPEGRRTLAAWRTALRHLPPLMVAAVAVTAAYVLLGRWANYSSKPATLVASYLTLTFRKPVRPSSVLDVFNGALWVVEWVVLPVLILPMVSAIAALGWRGFRGFGSGTRRWLYWIQTPVLLLCAIWIPWKILQWVPQMSSFRMEVLSFGARVFVAYLLFVAAWLLLAFVTSGGKPRLAQSNTTVSP
jgi:hypothetical protein